MKTLNILATLAFATGLAFAQTGTPTQAEIETHRAKIDAAIAARDYDAWKAEHQAWNPNDTRLNNVTAENFEKFAQMREARKSGDMQKASELRGELGIEPGSKGKGQGQGMGKKNGQGSGNCTGSGQGTRKGQAKGKGRI